MEFDRSKKYVIVKDVVMLKCQHVFGNGEACGYEWVPVAGEPKKCPRCQQFEWRGVDD